MILNVCQHGVHPDGTTKNTAALQKLLDGFREQGGGVLEFPPGRYLTGGLILPSHVHLHFAPGATLLGSPALEDYTVYDPSTEPFPEGKEGVRALLSAVDCENIRISGAGTIDGQGALFHVREDVRAGRPRNLWFARCRGIRVEGLALRNSGFWMQHYIACDDVFLSGLNVWNHGGTNNDGLDIDGCRDVSVENCRFDTTDDAICLKTGGGRPVENVIVSNCFTRTHCNHFKTGSETRGDFRNIFVDGLVMSPSEITESHPQTLGADWRGACGIALSSADGGDLDRITVQNVRMDQVRIPFFVSMGDRARCADGTYHHEGPGKARHVTLRNIEALRASGRASFVIGLPDSPIRDLRIEECRIENEEGPGDPPVLFDVPERRDARPSMEAFGALPAAGVFFRHVHGAALRGVTIRTTPDDPRPHLLWTSCRDFEIRDAACENTPKNSKNL